MIVQMKFLNITGPTDDIDRVTEKYLSKYEIQLEQPMSELKTTDNLRPFNVMNPYRELLQRAQEYEDYLPDGETAVTPDTSLSYDEMDAFLRNLNSDYHTLTDRQDALKKERDKVRNSLMLAEPFKSFNFDLHEVMQYQFIRFRFGRIPIEAYHRFEKYVFDNIGALFIEGGRDETYIYGIYFVAHSEVKKLDPIFASLRFERLYIPDEYRGTPAEACNKLRSDIDALTKQINDCAEDINALFQKRAAKIVGTRKHLEEMSRNYDVRKLAAQVQDKHENYYLLCGWMPEDQVEKFLKDIKDDDKVIVVVEEDKAGYFGDAPTKLKNPKLFKPFESFIDMYGVPASDEIDPTVFMALTYAIIFGSMFGDVGQGLVLFLVGLGIYMKKKQNLAAIVSMAGACSTVFGFIYGSFFGFEDVIKPLWKAPKEALTSLPLVGKINTVFIIAIGFGMLTIIFCMILHIINAVKAGDKGSALFDTNGVAGLVFYASAAGTIVLRMKGYDKSSTILAILMFGVPLVLMALREPIEKMMAKKSARPEEGVGMFIVQAFFELFETLLSYFSNTLSFVRIGAFAIIHGAMMQVVLELSGAETGNINWVGIILGNLFVCLMEGLVVGIQVLRLEYYEIFSRFYKGSGKKFKPYTKKNKKNK